MTFDVEISDRYIPVGMPFFPILHAVDTDAFIIASLTSYILNTLFLKRERRERPDGRHGRPARRGQGDQADYPPSQWVTPQRPIRHVCHALASIPLTYNTGRVGVLGGALE
jgi:hypothetical protein